MTIITIKRRNRNQVFERNELRVTIQSLLEAAASQGMGTMDLDTIEAAVKERVPNPDMSPEGERNYRKLIASGLAHGVKQGYWRRAGYSNYARGEGPTVNGPALRAIAPAIDPKDVDENEAELLITEILDRLGKLQAIVAKGKKLRKFMEDFRKATQGE